MIREMLRQKRNRIFDESEDSDEVQFPENIFEQGDEVDNTCEGSDAEMDFEVGTIQSNIGRCIIFL